MGSNFFFSSKKKKRWKEEEIKWLYDIYIQLRITKKKGGRGERERIYMSTIR